jgi:hypothetical protein
MLDRLVGHLNELESVTEEYGRIKRVFEGLLIAESEKTDFVLLEMVKKEIEYKGRSFEVVVVTHSDFGDTGLKSSMSRSEKLEYMEQRPLSIRVEDLKTEQGCKVEMDAIKCLAPGRDEESLTYSLEKAKRVIGELGGLVDLIKAP